MVLFSVSSAGSVTQKTGSFTRTTSQVDTQTVTQPTSQKLTNQSKEGGASSETKPDDVLGKKLASIFPVIRMMQLQVSTDKIFHSDLIFR